ncbi:hypothetical protein [Rhodopseudomonas palustris]
MTKIKDLHKAWSKDATYRADYDALEEEFTVMAAVAKARRRAGLSQAELARRMKPRKVRWPGWRAVAASPRRGRWCVLPRRPGTG